jgi:hypothetical protein
MTTRNLLVAALLSLSSIGTASAQQDTRFSVDIRAKPAGVVTVDVLISRDTMFIEVRGAGLPPSTSVPILVHQGTECRDEHGPWRGSILFGVNRDLVFRAPRGPHYGVTDASGNVYFAAARSMSLMGEELRALSASTPNSNVGPADLRRLAGRAVSLRAQNQGPVPVEIGCATFRRR